MKTVYPVKCSTCGKKSDDVDYQYIEGGKYKITCHLCREKKLADINVSYERAFGRKMPVSKEA